MSEHNNRLAEVHSSLSECSFSANSRTFTKFIPFTARLNLSTICAYLTVGYDYGVFAEYSEFRE